VLKKLFIVLCAIGLSTSAANAESWVSCEEKIGLTIQDGNFQVFPSNADPFTCKVLFWPAKNPVALLKCDNGKYSEYEPIDESELIFDKYSFKNVALLGDYCQ
jgi:hypothetical protein